MALAALTTVLVQCVPVPAPKPSPPQQVSATPHPTAPPPPSTTPEKRPAAVSPVTAADLGSTWHPGCPLAPEQLRRVALDYWGMDAKTHRGELVVNQDLTDEVITVFDELYRLRYPIEKMQTPDHYPGGQDELSMRDDNTSAYNCRDIPGSGSWSLHAYGRAVDVNPLRNPCVYAGGAFEPHNAAAYLDRGRTDPGLLHAGDPAVRAFAQRGWQWGGLWTTPIDYQHFERP
jgi:hypothetical protein